MLRNLSTYIYHIGRTLPTNPVFNILSTFTISQDANYCIRMSSHRISLGTLEFLLTTIRLPLPSGEDGTMAYITDFGA